MLKPIVLGAFALVLLAAPALARSHGHGHHHWHPYRHVVRHHARFPARGIPITAGSDAIRINAVGEVISKPSALIEKDRKFRVRADRDLAKTRATQPGASAQP